jgi:hypothetical protein
MVFGGVYEPPSMSDEQFYTDFGQTVDKIISKYLIPVPNYTLF